MKQKIIKKFFAIAMLLLPLMSIALPYTATAADNGQLLAQVQINKDLKPGFAAEVNLPGGTPRAQGANAIMQLLAGGLIYIAGPIGVLMLAIGGLRYVVSRGDQTQMEEAKKTIVWSIIGLVVIILSWAIITNVMWIALQGGVTGTDVPKTASGGTAQTGGTTGGNGGESGGGGESTDTSTPPVEDVTESD